MSKQIEALKLALEALEEHHYGVAQIIICEALAQPEQEPVAWEQFYPEMGSPKLAYLSPTESPDNACYIPPHRTWVGLTDEEAFQICVDCGCLSADWLTLLNAIEAKLKEKNT